METETHTETHVETDAETLDTATPDTTDDANELDLLKAKNAELSASVDQYGVQVAEREAEIQRLKAAMYDLKNSIGAEPEATPVEDMATDVASIDDLFED